MGAENRTEIIPGPAGAWLESITWRGYTAMGALWDPASGRVVGYVAHDVFGPVLASGAGDRVLCRLRCVSTWRTPRSWLSSTQSAYRATIDGAEYVGRGAGEGCLLRLRKSLRA
jgi:hypothetical protein